MASNNREILSQVETYYTGKLVEHGATPRGVDWNGTESQELRFAQLCRIIEEPTFTIADLGCGYGAFYTYLAARYGAFTYAGYDVSQAMVEAAAAKTAGPNASFRVASAPLNVADYTVASGVFNVRLDRNDEEWSAYVTSLLHALDKGSTKGFAFNCLTKYSDSSKMRPHLYYADPCALFDVCKRTFSRNVALLHDYGLYEFTILVRKNT